MSQSPAPERRNVADSAAVGIDPYPPVPPIASRLHDILAEATHLAPRTTGRSTAAAGRVIAVTYDADALVVRVRDGSGPELATELTAHLMPQRIGPNAGDSCSDLVGVGDHVYLRGELTATPDLGPVLRVDELTHLSKVRRSPTGAAPSAGGGTSLLSADVRHRLIARAKVTAALRSVLAAHDFLEVETPLLEPAPDDVDDRPFQLRGHAPDRPLVLRTSAEFALKRLVAGGLDRVYEIARSFRDEPPDATHNLEYTLLEVYQAYQDHAGIRTLAQELIRKAARAARGTTVITAPSGLACDLDDEWTVTTVHNAVSHAVGEDVSTAGPRLHQIADAHGVHAAEHSSDDQIVVALYEHLVEPRTSGPTFYTDFPRSTAPLARPHRDNAVLAEKWDLVIFGREIAAACTELIDPVELRRQLDNQAAASPADRKPTDAALLDAYDHGAPPTAGLVIGIDRLIMTITGATRIR